MVMAIISDCGTRLHPAMDYTYLTMVDALPNLVFIQLLLLFRVARVQMLLCSPFQVLHAVGAVAAVWKLTISAGK